jgi:hypothetical protein
MVGKEPALRVVIERDVRKPTAPMAGLRSSGLVVGITRIIAILRELSLGDCLKGPLAALAG